MADRPQHHDDEERVRRRRRNNQDEPMQNEQEAKEELILPIPPTPGTDLTYPELLRLPAQDPVPEVYEPQLIPAVYRPTQAILLDHQGRTLDPNQPNYDGPPPLTLIHDTSNPTHGYALLPDKPAVNLNHHGDGWGQVVFAVVYPRLVSDPPNVYRAPDPSQPPAQVAIKILNKHVVNQQLQLGGKENPYKEICRLQELGDNVHVIRCEALHDSERLFIVTPLCQPLVEIIFDRFQRLGPHAVHTFFQQMLRILRYLQMHNIHQRDFSPDNLFILPNGQLVLTDLAMSLRIPTVTIANDATQRTLIKSQGNFGTTAWMAPEIYHLFPFDGVTADLWCVGHILYNMLTRDILMRAPSPTDWSYRFFVLAGGLTNEGMNARTIEVMEEIAEQADRGVHQQVLNRAIAHMAFPPSVRTLLRNIFQNAPHERWTLGQVLRCDYVIGGPE